MSCNLLICQMELQNFKYIPVHGNCVGGGQLQTCVLDLFDKPEQLFLSANDACKCLLILEDLRTDVKLLTGNGQGEVEE